MPLRFPAGNLNGGIKRERKCLRQARNVGDKCDGGPELTKRAGEAKNPARNDAWHGKRHRDGKKARHLLAPNVRAANAMRGFWTSKAIRTARTIRGNPIIPAANAAPRQEKAMPPPKTLSRNPPIGVVGPKESSNR